MRILFLFLFLSVSIHCQTNYEYIGVDIIPACTTDGSIEVLWIESPFSQLTSYWYDGQLHNQDYGQELAEGILLENVAQGYYTLLILASSGCRAEYEFYVPSR
jgi:hypothetical protein